MRSSARVCTIENCLPLRGSLPDMAADTNSYVTLQKLYQTQANVHAESIYRRALQISHNLGLSMEFISESEVSLILLINYIVVTLGRRWVRISLVPIHYCITPPLATGQPPV